MLDIVFYMCDHGSHIRISPKLHPISAVSMSVHLSIEGIDIERDSLLFPFCDELAIDRSYERIASRTV